MITDLSEITGIYVDVSYRQKEVAVIWLRWLKLKRSYYKAEDTQLTANAFEALGQIIYNSTRGDK